ncbi:hypothetical protein HOLleu_17524 [Holothuria leucospilota]|uniref:Uncharacterized protein n=1 Tax=Holothuria leucospilota TaxID=206669 RepID=A0A9Q1C0I6_HOLLE|nr:hypothetical protein HOLleu_17524 [Holothuria leucospilota]
MKSIFAFGLLVFCWNVSIAQIIPMPIEIVPRKPVPDHGYCYRNMWSTCTTAGIKVQSKGEDCVECICDGEQQGALCCMKSPYPVVRFLGFCDVVLDTTTCQYERTPKFKHARHACCIRGYETSVIQEDLQNEFRDRE